MDKLKRVLPHICIILAGMMIIFFIVDNFSDAMGLIDNPYTKALLLVFGIVAIIVSSMLIYRQRRDI